MFCSNCGAQNPDGSSFCSGCGQPLVQAQPQQPVQQPVQQTYQQPMQQPVQQFSQPMPAYQPQMASQYQAPELNPELGSSCATASLVCGLIAFFTSSLFLPSLILSIVGIKKANTAKRLGDNSGKRKAGKVFSIIALIASFIMPFILIASIITMGAASYVDRAKEASRSVEEHNSRVEEVQKEIASTL